MSPRLLIITLLIFTTTVSGFAKTRSRPVAVFHLEPHPGGTYMMTLRANVRGQQGNFMFDTGGGISYVSPAFAQTIGCKPWGQLSGFVLTGQRLDMKRCDNLMFYIDRLLVFGRDALAGVSTTAVAPVSVSPAQGNTEQRTYQVVDRAGNTLTLVLKVKAEGRQLQGEIVTLQYNSGTILSAPENKLRYEWQTEQNGALRKLEQDLEIDGSADQEVEAEFRADRNQTVITTKHPKQTTVQTGLVLLSFASGQGQLVIEY